MPSINVKTIDSHEHYKNPKHDSYFVACGLKFCLTTMKLTVSFSLGFSRCVCVCKLLSPSFFLSHCLCLCFVCQTEVSSDVLCVPNHDPNSCAVRHCMFLLVFVKSLNLRQNERIHDSEMNFCKCEHSDILSELQ